MPNSYTYISFERAHFCIGDRRQESGSLVLMPLFTLASSLSTAVPPHFHACTLTNAHEPTHILPYVTTNVIHPLSSNCECAINIYAHLYTHNFNNLTHKRTGSRGNHEEQWMLQVMCFYFIFTVFTTVGFGEGVCPAVVLILMDWCIMRLPP